jgi:hypothetical protein
MFLTINIKLSGSVVFNAFTGVALIVCGPDKVHFISM